MSNSAKLKKKAAEFEAKKHYEKALEVYEQVLSAPRAPDEERDVALYNRVGDLHYRIGNNEQAINYYEQAADYYADGGFFNNAIALCNKILRYSPGRTIIYYKLGMISAKKGFTSDAKQNFLEYADRMQRIGKMDDAFRALKEFADLCPGQDDVRLMLAEQLARADRKPEALEQLEVLYDTLLNESRATEANATLERIKALDPAFKPRRSTTPRARKKEGLVFLDLDFEDDVPVAAGAAEVEIAIPRASDADEPTTAERGEPTPEGFVERPESPSLEGLEATSLADDPSLQADQEENFVSHGELTFITPANDADDAPMVESTTDVDGLDSVDGDEDGADIVPIDLDSLVEIPDGIAPERDPKIIEFPIERTPARGNPALMGLDLISDDQSDEASDEGSDDSGFIDLGEWLERTRTPASTRMITHDEEPENNEQKDFSDMLDKFKAGISRNVDDEDFESHYDLGIAFREMGLLDEAIGSFQKASRGANERVRASEAIGQCFMDKGEAAVTMTVLERLLKDPEMGDSQLVGVLYLLGRAAESLGRPAEAAGYFQRVLAVQIGFRDAADRLNSLAQASR